jgi:hypothetical protein
MLREQLGSILCTKNREPAYASVFRRAVPAYHGLSFFFLERLSSFFSERKEERCEKIV